MKSQSTADSIPSSKNVRGGHTEKSLDKDIDFLSKFKPGRSGSGKFISELESMT